jgi:hypothetical protein
MPKSSDSPLSIKNLVAGILITVIGGIILAYIIQDARFSSSRKEEQLPIIPTVILPTITVTPPPLGFLSLNDYSNVFSMYYPAEFDQVSVLESNQYMEYGYFLRSTSGQYLIWFYRLSETPLSDEEWKSRVNRMMSAWLSEKTNRTLISTRNSENEQHSFLFEAKDASINSYILYLMEESDGIEMTATALIYGDKWAVLRDNAIVSLDSIKWSSIEARKIIESP